MYHPSANLLDPADHGVPEMQNLLWTRRMVGSNRLVPRGPEGLRTIVYFHGNGGHIGHRAGKVNAYLNAGYGLLLVCYRGYRRNLARRPKKILLRMVRLASDPGKLRGADRTNSSVRDRGTGVATAFSTKAVSALILEAPFTSIADVAQHHYFYLPARYLIKDRFESGERIKRSKAPLLIIHGERSSCSMEVWPCPV